jgi:uncharacterized protein (TIGR02246 family)
MFPRRNRNIARTLAALALLAAPAATLLAAGEPDFADSVGAAWEKAFKANDLDGVAKLYAEDAVAWFPDEAEHRGAAAIRESYQEWLDGVTIVDAKLSNSHHLGDASHRTNWGNFTLTMKQKSDGKIITMTGRYTDVQEKRKGKWVYIVDHASADPPAKSAGK